MKKAEKIFEDTFTACRIHVRDFGLEFNPNGEAIGFNGLITEDVVCTRTVNAVQKLVDSKLREWDIFDKYDTNGDEGRARRDFWRQAMKMVQSTINNERKSLKEWKEFCK